jgi:hypothetical protein
MKKLPIRGRILVQRRQLWTPRIVMSASKFAARTVIGVGGAAIASASYYGDQLKSNHFHSF